MPSGVYGARLRCAGHEDVIPFYVRPAYGRPTAKVLFIGSTYTFQAYANHARGNLDDAFRARIRDWGAFPHNTDEIGRAHVRTPGPNSHLVCRLLLSKKK